jgi:hypothetical protein
MATKYTGFNPTTEIEIEQLMGGTKAARLFANLLTTKRPANTHGEYLAAFAIERFLKKQRVPFVLDQARNIIVDMRDEKSTVLFSAHYDSAHRGIQPNGYTNEVALSDDGLYFSGVDACIGADDASGIFVMARMIMARVPALYIFHASEEVGGVGSHYIVENTPEVLDDITHAIAFDRRGTRDIIWQQGGQTCASEGTAGVFAYLLNRHGFDYQPDDGGSFTDTKLYRNLVPECFNVSVGYGNEHTSAETQDIQHLLKLADVCCELDWSALPVWRDPSRIDYYNNDWYGAYSPRYDSRVPVNPAAFNDWDEFILADFDAAMEHAHDVAELKDAWYLDAIWEAQDQDIDAAVFQWCSYANLKYPLQGETK